MAALAVTTSAASGSGHANLTGAIWATSNNIDGSLSALPVDTDDDTLQVAQISLMGKERYFDLTATAGNGSLGTYAAAVWMLEKRSGETGKLSADFGCDELLRVA